MMTALCFAVEPWLDSARSRSGNDRPPMASPPTFKKSRRDLPSQKPLRVVPWIESMGSIFIRGPTGLLAGWGS